MTSIATQSLIDDFTDTTGQIIEVNHSLVVEYPATTGLNIKYAFWRVYNIEQSSNENPATISLIFWFYADNNKNLLLNDQPLGQNGSLTIWSIGSFNITKETFNIYISNQENGKWKNIFETVYNSWLHESKRGQEFQNHTSPFFEERGPSLQQGGKKEFKNYGGGGKKLTRKNRKHLMKLYRKNRTRKHRGGGKIDDSDGLIRLYTTDEALKDARDRGYVQHYLRDVTWKNHSTGQEETEQYWMTAKDIEQFHTKIMLRQNERDAVERMRKGETMMNTIASDEVNKDWGLYEAAAELVVDESKTILFTGNFHEFRRTDRVAFSHQTLNSDGTVSPTKQNGGGKELPTFESTKTKLKQILEKVKPDNEYYEFSQKLNQELNKIKEKKFNEFVNKIYENFDTIMSIPVKQKGGMPRTRRSTRNDSLDCPICLEPLTDPPDQRILECSFPQGQHKVHEDCIRLTGVNKCPVCRDDNTYLDAHGDPIVFNPVQRQIYDMAAVIAEGGLGPPMGMHEYHNLISRRRIDALRHRSLALRERVRENINLYWGMFLFLFTCHSLGAAWRGQYSSNYLTVIAMFYGSVIAVGLWPETPGSVSMTDQLVELIVRIMTFLDDMPGGMANAGGGKKTRRKRYKRKKRTKRKMRKKRGGMKIGDMVKKKYKMDKLDEYGNPTGKKFWKDFKGLVQNIDNEGNTTIYWYADKSTDVLTKIQSNSLKVIQPKPVAIGDMHQADIPPLTGVSYTGDEKFNPLPAHELTPAIKPTGYVSGIPNRTNYGFEGTREWG